jgi:hypothetical protein
MTNPKSLSPVKSHIKTKRRTCAEGGRSKELTPLNLLTGTIIEEL